LLPQARAALAPGITVLQTATAVLTPDGGMPQRAAQVQLPHRWDHAYPRDGGTAIYLLTLPPAASTEPHAFFFSRIGNQAEVRLDGLLLATLGKLGDPQTDHAKAPVWVDVPATMLRGAQSSTLQITVTAQANRWGGLSTVMFGPASQLRPEYLSNYRWRQVASVVIVMALALMALMAGGLWWQQRDELYGLLALAALFGVVRMSDRLLIEPPLPWPLWGAVTAAAFLAHLMFMARFALRAVGEQGAWISKGFWAVMVSGTVAAFASFVFQLPALWTATLAATAVPGVIVLVCAARAALRTRSHQAMILCAAGAVVILTGFRDFWAVRLAESGSATFSLLPHANFVFVLFMGWIIVERYSHQVVQYRELNESLETRIAQREAELGATHERLARQTEEQAMLRERQRIMRDIHDGVGAHLVSLLSLAKRGDIPGDALQAQISVALDELRVAVDSLQPVHGDLTTVLATLRYRLQPRLEAAGLEVVWDVSALPALDNLNPEMVLQIQRILLEAFTNVLRHARATRIEVSARATEQPRALVLEVADNGVGFEASPQQRHGLGMSSMQSRSEKIGATLTVNSTPGQGTRLRLELPRA
jgi:signal transduction histidine kinase